MKSLKISVIIPAHNEEDVIERAIKSVLNQTFKNFEIIVSNDGSTDNTKNIVEELMKEDNRIKIINRDKGHSAAFARNRGAEITKGKILVFLDADTFINNIFLEEIEKKFKELNNIDAVINICLPLKQSLISRILSGFLSPPFKLKLTDGGIYDNKNHQEAGTMFFCLTKKAYLKIGGYNENIFYFEDESFSKKFYALEFKSTFAKKAIQYFELPSNFKEFLRQCKWIGKGIQSIQNKNERKKKNFIWFLKALFLIFPLFFLWNLNIFLTLLIFTFGSSYLILIKRNKNPSLSMLTLPFLYLKTFFVCFNILKFMKRNSSKNKC